LPIENRLDEIVAALATAGATVLLHAPPGAGKTTRLPLSLLDRHPGEGRIVMLEPRRLAARAAAERMASTLGEPVGRTVGYGVRMEKRWSRSTRLLVVTAGVFLRQLQADPELEGVHTVIFDEFHERGAEMDLALALVRHARSLICPELRLLVMSATLDLESLADRLDRARVISSPGRSHPVDLIHQPPRPRESLERQVVRGLEGHWLDNRQDGETALVFLPGRREIGEAQHAIASTEWGREVECLPLHGDLPLGDQHQAIAPAATAAGKVVLATSIAESSLTIHGVRLVIDSGLSRRSRYNPCTAMEGLVTVVSSLASAEQRRGRAGRLAPGRCLRLWSPGEDHRRPTYDVPGLMEADLLPIALELAYWGADDRADLPWLQAPPAATLKEARAFLEQLGALDDTGMITGHGRTMARLGLHPRLGHMLLLAHSHGCLHLACELAALLSERDPLDRREAGCDLLQRLDWLRSHPPSTGGRAVQPIHRGCERQHLERLISQLHRQVHRTLAASCRGHASEHGEQRPIHAHQRASGSNRGEAMAGVGTPSEASEAEDTIVSRLISWAYPDRIALNRGGSDGRFLMRGGRGALLPRQDSLSTAEALAIATVDGHGQESRVLLAVQMDTAVLEEHAVHEGEELQRVWWDGKAQRVRAEKVLHLGALKLGRRVWPDPDPAAVSAAMLIGIRQTGLTCLPWTPSSRQLQRRLAMAHRCLGEPWPDRRAEQLESDLDTWLGPHITGMRTLGELARMDLVEALWGNVAWPLRRELDRLLPESLIVPSGRRVRIDYSAEVPVLAVKLQEMFGSVASPTLLDGALSLTLHLLSPAGRPAAITTDLARFWQEGYPLVRRELRGRYPRHPWPEDPLTTAATALTKARLASKTH
jgi:ATP-dependent helicase HrpB